MIFPCIYEGVWKYWVARSYLLGEKRKLAPKGPRHWVFNYHADTALGSLIITEGPISAIVAGRDAIALFGKTYVPRQLEDAQQISKNIRIYVSLDGDAWKEEGELCDVLHRKGMEIYRVGLQYGSDPASLGRSEFRKRIEQAPRYLSPEDMEAQIGRCYERRVRANCR